MRMTFGFFLAAIVLVANPGRAQEIALTDPEMSTIQQHVLLPFFEGLKNGDIAVIKKHMSRDLYERNRVLLDENLEYPAFLRKYYRDISFRVVRAEKNSSGEGVVFHVSFDTAGDEGSTNELKLSKEKRGNPESDVWVIEEF
jgi:hypothetical protein